MSTPYEKSLSREKWICPFCQHEMMSRLWEPRCTKCRRYIVASRRSV